MRQAKEHNEKSLVCQFPQEVYDRIFLECVRIPPEGPEDWGWVTLSYVCRSWRIAALRSHGLWTFVDFSSPQSLEVSLGRAKGAPLSIRAVVGEHNIRQLKSVLATAHQISDVHLHSSVHNISPLLETLAHPHPTLTHLVVNVSTHNLPYPRPDFPLSDKEVRLRTVELNDAPLYLIPYRCPSLTRLSLHNLPSSERRSDLYKLFSSITQLQYLTVCDCTITGEPLQTSIFLPCLRILEVVGSLQQVSDLLELVNIPPFCQLSCSLTQLDDISDNLWRLYQAIGTHSYTSSHDMPLETLTLTCTEISSRFTTTYEFNPNFRQSIRLCAFGRMVNSPSAVFDITIGPGNQSIPDDAIITILTGIWRALLLTNVRTLSVHNVDIITQKTWTQFLRTLLHLRVLDIRGYAPFGLVWALLLDALLSDMAPSRFLVPRLDDIYLYGVDCSSGGLMLVPAGQTNSHGNLDESSFLDVFVAALKHRQQHRLRLRSVTVTGCGNVIEERLKDIKHMGSHLVWDIRGKVKEMEVGYRNVHPNMPKDSLRHYNRLKALFS